MRDFRHLRIGCEWHARDSPEQRESRLSVGGVGDEWVTRLRLQMQREALQKLNRQANKQGRSLDTVRPNFSGFDRVWLREAEV